MEFFSIRDPLKGRLDDFCTKAQMREHLIQDGLIAIVEKLKTYREEGRALWPEVYIFKSSNAAEIKKIIPYYDGLTLGKGDLSYKNFEISLKKTAPLAREGWNIYIEVGVSEISYGVFRSKSPFYSVPISNILIANAGEVGSSPIIYIKKVAENVVCLKGILGAYLEVHFSTRDQSSSPWHLSYQNLVNAITKDVEEAYKDSCKTFYSQVINDAVIFGHGCLVGVVPDSKNISKSFQDGCIFSDPISIPDKIRDVLTSKVIENYADLHGLLPLVGGMLGSDGITLFDTSGKVIGYNVFIKNDDLPGVTVVGGARKRTYETMKKLIQNKELYSAFILSQDGECDCYWSQI